MKMMKTVRVTALPDDSVITISLQIGSENKTFNRPISETMERTIARIRTTINQARSKHIKKTSKKVAKLQGATTVHDTTSKNEPTITLLNMYQNEISFDQNSVDAWKSASIFQIDDEPYNVLFNPPAVTQISISAIPLAGMTIYPRLQFSHTLPGQSRFAWYRSEDKVSVLDKMAGDVKKGVNMVKNDSPTKSDCNSWVLVGHENTYTPSNLDVGHIFKLEVMPGNENYPLSESFDGINPASGTSGVVQTGPDQCIFESRHKYTKSYCDKHSMRVVCYNILANCYATTDFALSSLFPYCSRQAIDIEYRLQLLQKEIEGYHGDIICLQEVDRFVFENHFAPVMSLQNYAAAFANKLQTKEGVAIFYNRSKYKLLSVENKILKESLQEDEINERIKKMVCNNDTLKSRVLSLGSCVLLAVLQSVEEPRRHLVIANTHLYFHPRSLNIRLIQISIILNLMQEKIKELRKSLDDNSEISYMLCGDLNSNPRTGLIEFLTCGQLSFHNADWYSGGVGEYHGTNTSLSHDMQLTSACGYPRYTNYVAGFVDCLDYIFINPAHLKVNQVLEQPPHALVTEHTALPSVIAPSDHIAQVVDLSWIPNVSA